MRILTACASLGRGGTERVAQTFSLQYRRMGHEVAVLAWGAGGPRQQALEAAGVPVFIGGEALDEALAAADRFDPHVIHIHRPGIYHPRETSILKRLRTGQRRVMETNVFARPDVTREAEQLIDVHLHLSEWSLWRWRRWLGRRGRARQIGVVVPNPVDVDGFTRADDAQIREFRARLGIPMDAFICGRVGQPNIGNWHAANVLAFGPLAQEDAASHLVLLGLPPSMRPLIDRLPASARSRVHLLDVTDSDRDLATLYSSLDCFLHCASAGESFGLVLAEAMLCGCPVVTAARPHKSNSHVDVVGHLQAGIIAGSAAKLSGALLMMRRDEALRRRLAEAARERIVGRFSASTVAARAIQVAELALAAPDRESLATALGAAPGLVTEPDPKTIHAMLANTLGGPNRRERMLMEIMNTAAFQRAGYYYLYWKIYRKYR